MAAQPPAPSTPQRAVALQRTLIKASEGELSALRALDPPAELKPAVDRYLSVRERGVALMEQGLRAAQKEDLPAYAAARRRLSAGQVSRLHLAQAVGFTACSRPGGSASGG